MFVEGFGAGALEPRRGLGADVRGHPADSALEIWSPLSTIPPLPLVVAAGANANGLFGVLCKEPL